MTDNSVPPEVDSVVNSVKGELLEEFHHTGLDYRLLSTSHPFPVIERIDPTDHNRAVQATVINDYLDILNILDRVDPRTNDYCILDGRDYRWGTATRCTNGARWLAYHLNGDVYGYSLSDNPDATIGETSFGHDFCVVGDFIVDYWGRQFSEVETPGIHHRSRLDGSLYGNPDRWEQLTVLPDHVDPATLRVAGEQDGESSSDSDTHPGDQTVRFGR